MLKQFWQHVEPEGDGCREWLKTIEKHSGYGLFRGMKAHVFAFMDANSDEDIWDMHIHHICENKKCVKPEHLIALTPGEHISLHKKGIKTSPQGPSQAKKDARKRYREEVTHCGQGHKFTDENTGLQKAGKYKSRYCKQCARNRSVEFNKTKYVPHPKPAPTHCPQGHEYTAENTKFGVRSNGKKKRYCRECNRLRGFANRQA